MVTIFNQGDAVVVGEIVLAVGWVETTTRRSGRHAPGLVIFGQAVVTWATLQMEGGDIIRVPENAIRDAFKRLLSDLESERSEAARKYDASLLILVTDARGFEPETGPFTGLLSACDLGIDFATAASLDLSRSFDMKEMRITMEGEGNGVHPATMEVRTPPIQPSTREILAWILEQLRELSPKKAKQG